MFQYMPHHRRFCDEPNQAHAPATPAALEWKHPIDARQQLCPQISRRVSCPRGTKICAHCLWPGCLTPRHQRPPQRVRCQHSKVAVPMLARWWYRCRNPIQKLACAQALAVKRQAFGALARTLNANPGDKVTGGN